MASPASLPPAEPGSDVAVHGWAGLTVRVAWTLLVEGVRVRPKVLRDARDHVLFQLDPSTPLAFAEDRAGWLVSRFVARARRKLPVDPWPQDAEMPLSPRWKRALDRSLTAVTGAVLRQHYGDGRSLEQLERILELDRIGLEAARGGLREVVRRAGVTDGLRLDEWPPARVDRLLQRLAAFSPGPCPPVHEVIDGHHREHGATCARCDRAYRLVRARVIAPCDLVPPAQGARPTDAARVLALHFHPDGRHHRDAIAREATTPCFPVGEDLLLLDLDRPDAVRELLVLAAEVGAPGRDRLRGVVLTGPGRWSGHGLLGPLVERADGELRSKGWGHVDGFDELPDALPVPPSARRWWAGVAALAVVGAGFGVFVARPAHPAVDHPLDVEFTTGRGGVWAAFDVDEAAGVTVVRQADRRLEVVVAADAAAKADLAVGDGSYRLHSMGDGILLAATSRPIEGLDAMLAGAGAAETPIDELADRIRAADPRADVRVWRR